MLIFSLNYEDYRNLPLIIERFVFALCSGISIIYSFAFCLIGPWGFMPRYSIPATIFSIDIFRIAPCDWVIENIAISLSGKDFFKKRF